MQINRTGKLLLAVFGGGGFVFLIAGAIVAATTGAIGVVVAVPIVFIGVIWALVTLVLAGFGRRQALTARHELRLFRSGLRGTATVLEASSGIEINGMPRMRLLVELDIPGRARRRATRQIIMPLFAARRMRPGLILPAYASPGNPDDFVLVW